MDASQSDTPTVRGILLDIEGTTSSIDFVYQVMFPYVRKHVAEFQQEHGDDASVRQAYEQIARDAGHESFEAWHAAQSSEPDASPHEALRRHVLGLMDDDVKSTGLKLLQGLIWKAGFESGEMQAHVYDDVPAALQRWHESGIDIRIYSSGSIAAQKLFFGHTTHGNLLHYFQGHYDTTTGPKREADSYRSIAADFSCPPDAILFVSDVVAELDAARQANLRTMLSIRPGNPPSPPTADHPTTTTFAPLP